MDEEYRRKFASDFGERRLIAVLRGIDPKSVLDVFAVLYENGIRFAEVTLNSPDPFESIRAAAGRFAGLGMHVGAGTVLKASEVDEVKRAKGTYIVSPGFDPAVVSRAKELGLVSIPGFFTPTEGLAAAAAGADYLKCFPAGSLGPEYIKSLRAVIASPIIAVGAVGLENMADFLAVSAGVGIGAQLYSPKKGKADLAQDAARFAAAAARPA